MKGVAPERDGTWVSPGNTLTFSTCSGASFHTMISVFSDPCEWLMTDDDGCHSNSALSSISLCGEVGVYRILVGTSSYEYSEESDSFTLMITSDNISCFPRDGSIYNANFTDLTASFARSYKPPMTAAILKGLSALTSRPSRSNRVSATMRLVSCVAERSNTGGEMGIASSKCSQARGCAYT